MTYVIDSKPSLNWHGTQKFLWLSPGDHEEARRTIAMAVNLHPAGEPSILRTDHNLSSNFCFFSTKRATKHSSGDIATSRAAL